MKPPLSLAIAACFLLAACNKNAPPSTPPDDAAAADVGPADATSDETDADTVVSDDDSDDVVSLEAPEGTTASAASVTDEYGAVEVVENPRAAVTETAKWANVKSEIRTPKGKIFKDEGKAFPYDQLTRIDFDFEGITHTFLLELSPAGKGKASVKLTYLAGGEEIVRNYGFDAKLNKRELLRLDDGTALALTVSTRTIKPLPKEERERLEGVNGNRDPLAGASKK